MATALDRVHVASAATVCFARSVNDTPKLAALLIAAGDQPELDVDDYLGRLTALALAADPSRFLSTVQIGITAVGLIAGAYSGTTLTAALSVILVEQGVPGAAADWLAYVGVFSAITYLSLIIGELVPKRIGQMFPETVARYVALPMEGLSTATRPFVWLLSNTTEAVLRLLRIRDTNNRGVTEEEIAASLEEGLDAGVIEAHEHQMVRNVFRLDERQVGSMMIPRTDIVWVDAEAPLADALAVMAEQPHARYPVCRGGLDDVVGVLSAQALLVPMARGAVPPLSELMQQPVFVPETLSGMELLEHFRVAEARLVFVVDEYGAVQGVITVRDVLEAITGEFSTPADDDSWAVRRDDGSWLMDGLIPVPELKDRLELDALPEEDRGRYNTLAGMIMLLLGRLPNTADHVEWEGWRFEVVDLDGKRVDKVLVTPQPAVQQTESP